MKNLFGFFLRLLICFVAAKLLLHAVGVEGRVYLLGLTALFLANIYGFEYLDDRERGGWRKGPQNSSEEAD